MRPKEIRRIQAGYSRKYRENNPEKIKERQARYYQTNKQKIKLRNYYREIKLVGKLSKKNRRGE